MQAPLPETIRVKLSSEQAGAISLTPVVSREMPLRELAALMLDLTGKDAARVCELLLRGTLVSGATRYRWASMNAGLEELGTLLVSFPDLDPSLHFEAERCVRVILSGSGFRAEIPREALCKKRLLWRSSFWDVLMHVVAGTTLSYSGYLHSEGADQYSMEVTTQELAFLRENAGLLCYTSLERQVRTRALICVEFVVPRSAGRPDQ